MGYIFIILSVLFFTVALIVYKITGMKKIFISVFLLHVISMFSAFGFLLRSFLLDDFSNLYVFNHSSADLPVYYKIAALWAGHQGSLLLWLVMISVVSLLYFSIENEVSIFEIVIHYINFIFLISILLIFSDPFVSGTAVSLSDGPGLNPVLNNFWMTVHPPLTFLGYSLALICFSSSIRRMVNQEYYYDHDQKIPVILVLLVLGTGLALGGVWAYNTLGWGGFWGWDPVENASLVPWLLSLVYVHSSILEKRYRQLIVHNNLTSAFIYVTVIIAVFLTRSGILQNSVHSFGNTGIAVPFLVYIFFLTVTVLFTASKYNKQKPSIIQDDYDFISHLSYAIISIGIFAVFIFSATVIPAVFTFAGRPFTVDPDLFPKAASIFAAAYIMSVFNYYYDNRSEDRFVLIASGILSLSTAYYFTMLSLYQYMIVFFSLMMFLYLFYKLIFHNRGSENKIALCSHIVVMLFITSAMLMNADSSFRYDLSAGQVFKAGNGSVEFSGYNEKSENIMFKAGGEHKIVPYYNWNNSTVTFPLIISENLSDVYIEPLRIVSARENATVFTVDKMNFLQWKDGNFVKLDDLTIRKKDSLLDVEAVLLFRNGNDSEKVSVSMSFEGEKITENTAENPFTGQTVKLIKFSTDKKIVQIYIEPDIFTKYKADTLEVTVSRKLYIKVIWAAFAVIVILFFFLLIKTFTSYELY
ncbi:MAG: cytochrome c biogenesis protein CcsA [Spirochaetes bacterium]|nr:cytochrome c biogenesis protein CcsA [Spirochaetota bacterium]